MLFGKIINLTMGAALLPWVLQMFDLTQCVLKTWLDLIVEIKYTIWYLTMWYDSQITHIHDLVECLCVLETVCFLLCSEFPVLPRTHAKLSAWMGSLGACKGTKGSFKDDKGGKKGWAVHLCLILLRTLMQSRRVSKFVLRLGSSVVTVSWLS